MRRIRLYVLKAIDILNFSESSCVKGPGNQIIDSFFRGEIFPISMVCICGHSRGLSQTLFCHLSLVDSSAKTVDLKIAA